MESLAGPKPTPPTFRKIAQSRNRFGQVVEKWLEDRNLRLSEEKTKIVQVEDGFDFLGFNLRTYKGTAIIKPSKAKVLSFCKEIGKTIKTLQGATQETVITKLNPILRGFANYYRGVCSKDTYNYIEHRLWQYLWRWAKRRHPNKPKKWTKEKYFHCIDNHKWVFSCKGKDRKGVDKWIKLFYMPSVPIERHVKVKGKSSPDETLSEKTGAGLKPIEFIGGSREISRSLPPFFKDSFNDPTLKEYWDSRAEKGWQITLDQR